MIRSRRVPGTRRAALAALICLSEELPSGDDGGADDDRADRPPTRDTRIIF